mmetsp:Transcript_33068/g.93596  ORF Transcript_33068/g.93596 Transcript_33068/m.93596 type:complete len:93 (+) Transcript_33068:1-279(+)
MANSQQGEAPFDDHTAAAVVIRTHQLSHWMPSALGKAWQGAELQRDLLEADGIEERLGRLLEALKARRLQLPGDLPPPQLGSLELPFGAEFN